MEEDRDREWECLPCGGPPPPQFSLPPPPRPPFLVDGECTEDGPLLAFEVCDAMPVLDAELHSSPALPSTAVIVGGCVLLLATLLIVSVLLFKYKRKVPHAAPNKAGAASASASSPAGPNMHRDGAPPAGLGGVGVGTGGDAAYDGSGSVRTRAPQPADSPQLQMTDLKSKGAGYPNGFPVLRDPSLYIGSHPYISEDLYNPVYEEISHGSGERGETDSELPASEDEFAEDELSLAEAPRPPRSPPPPVPPPSLLHPLPLPLAASAGSLDGRSRPPPPGAASASELPFYEPPSPDLRFSRRTVAHLPSPPPPAPAPGGATVGSVRRSRGHRSNDSEFHEGLLLDALLHQLYYQHQHQHSLPFAGAHAADLYGPTPTSPQPPHRTLPHFYHHPSAEVFTTLRHHHGVPATPSPVQHRHHHHQQQQRRRPPVAHSGSALGLS